MALYVAVVARSSLKTLNIIISTVKLTHTSTIPRMAALPMYLSTVFINSQRLDGKPPLSPDPQETDDEKNRVDPPHADIGWNRALYDP